MRTVAVSMAGFLAAISAAARCAAATLEVSVVDEHGKPIEHVAVYAHATQTAGEQAPVTQVDPPAAPKAIMDQLEHQFVPHVLVVQTGTEVTFPNSDDVSHHVYSFSPTKAFELPLYKGDVYPPVVFDRPGIVIVGCNIHDGMLGYIRVVDTPLFAVTDDRGVASIDGLADGAYAVEAWTPRARPAELPAAQLVAVSNGSARAEIRIEGRLAPPHAHGASSLTWERY